MLPWQQEEPREPHHFTEQTDTFVAWRGADYGSQGLVALHDSRNVAYLLAVPESLRGTNTGRAYSGAMSCQRSVDRSWSTGKRFCQYRWLFCPTVESKGLPSLSAP